ncbi:MAG TPA: BTAD domain-containing putative transcriptional regulator [Pseudonocardia sp.]|nr:BTAD domain-containing putative transcriptional regulator [Pseudonocardia sp.]
MPAVLRILGPIEVVVPHGEVVLGGAKERCLLAVLAVHTGEVVAEERLVDALWGGSPPRTAVKTLQNYVLRLRRRLKDCHGLSIVTRPPGYLLAGSATDVRLAESLVAQARSAAAEGEYATAVARFDAALALWRGPAIAEFADRDFARTEAARLDELRASVAEDRVDAVLAAGRHHEAVADCEQLVAAHPLRERRWTQLMLALYRDGRQGEALAAYRRLRDLLAEQLGVDPGLQAREAEAAILRHDAALSPRPPAARAAAAASPCVGRDKELSTLLAYVADATEGRGRVAFLCGEPGIGKTRLLAELAVEATSRGTLVLPGRCLEGAGALPYHPFVEAIEACLDGGEPPPAADALRLLLHRHRADAPSGPELRPDEVRTRLLDGVARFLVGRAAAMPIVLLLDDLHWADDATVAMLRHTARSTPGRRLLVIGAYRSGEVGHALEEALGALRSEAVCSVLRLTGLDRGSLERLMGATAGAPVAADLVDAVRDETDGNPFFAREVVAHLQEDGMLRRGPDGRLHAGLPLSAVPEGVRQVIGRRRRRLSEEANRLLDVAAAVEGPFLFAPINAAAEMSDAAGLEALDDVLAAGLVVADGAPDRYDFTHALIRHTVYQELNPSRRLRLHRDLAAALAVARDDGARISAAEVATQYHRAATLPGASAGVAPAVEAAERAEVAGAHDEQATFLRIACDLLPPDDGRRAALLGRRAVALGWALRFDEAVDAARAACRAGCGVATAAEVAAVLATAGSNRHAWQLAAAGLAMGASERDAPESWATLTLLDLDRREADDPHHPGMPLDLPGRRSALRILYESGRLAGRGDLARYAVAALHGSRASIPPDAGRDATVAGFLLGDYASAVPLFTADATAAEARGQLAWAVYCWAGAARCQVALGDLVAGRATIDHTRGLVARLPELALGWQLLHHQGAEDALVMVVDEGWADRRSAFVPWLAPGPDRHWGIAAITSIGARIEARMGHRDAALPLIATSIRALRQAPAWAPNFCRMACEVAETLWLLDRRDHLSVIESALRDKALPADFRFPMTDGRLALARLCALAGRSTEATHWFGRAREVLDAQGARPLRAVVDHDEALMHLRSGDASAAEPYITAARTAFDELGMTGWARRLVRSTAGHIG